MGSTREFVLYGAGGHASSVADVVRASGGHVRAFVDDVSSDLPELDAPVHRSVTSALGGDYALIIPAIGDNYQRWLVCQRLLEAFGLDHFGSAVHPRATVAPSTSIGPGSVVMPGAVVGSGVAIGTGVIINTGAIVEHGCVLDDFCSIGPGAAIAGRTFVGMRSVVAIGAVAGEKVRIGSDAVLGAASYLHTDLGDCSIAYGVPAKVVRQRDVDEPYLR